MRTLVHALVLALLASIATAGPAVFQTLTPEAAVELAKEDGRIVVIDFTAEWCGPCKTMDRITWSNDRVVKWLNDNAVAIQVDVDRDKKSAGKFRVTAMPTVVVMRNGKVAARSVGLKNADQFLNWAKRFERKQPAEKPGAASRDKAPNASGADEIDPAIKADIERRIQNASQTICQQRYTDAGEQWLWLWDNAVEMDPSYRKYRNAMFATMMGQVVPFNASLKSELVIRRDRVTPLMRKRPLDQDALDEWIALNHALGDDEFTLKFIDSLRGRPEMAAMLSPSQEHLVEILIPRGRWADAGAIIDPDELLAGLRRTWPMASMVSEDYLRKLSVDRAGAHYASLLAAGRDEDAEKFADGVFGIAGQPRFDIAMVERAIEVREPRQHHRDWLAQAAREGANVGDVNRSLSAALRSANGR